MFKRSPLLTSRKKGARLTLADQELVVEVYFAVGTIQGTATKLGLSTKLVTSTIKLARKDPTLMAARERVVDSITGQLQGKMQDVLESITPDELETRTEKVYTEAGLLRNIITVGPTLRDKATVINQFTSAAKNMAETTQISKGGVTSTGMSALLMPENVEDARRLIAQKLKKLRIVEMEFSDNPEISTNLQKIQRKSGVTDQEIADAEIDELSGADPFD